MNLSEVIKVLKPGYVELYINDEMEASVDTEYLNTVLGLGDPRAKFEVTYIGINEGWLSKDTALHWVIKIVEPKKTVKKNKR